MEDHEQQDLTSEFSAGQPAIYIPHTRANSKPLLVYNNNLYADTNVKIGKNGTHYYKCIDAHKGCPATAHTRVVDNVDVYLKELPNRVPHYCSRGPVHIHAVRFANHVYQACVETLEARHPALHSSLFAQYRDKLNEEGEREKFDGLVSECYSYKIMKSTMSRGRIDVVGTGLKKLRTRKFRL